MLMVNRGHKDEVEMKPRVELNTICRLSSLKQFMNLEIDCIFSTRSFRADVFADNSAAPINLPTIPYHLNLIVCNRKR